MTSKGYTLRCPECRSLDTYYSAGHKTWVCNACGLSEAPIEDWQGGVDYHNLKEEDK